MNIWGKVQIWLVVVLAAVGLALGSRVLDIRHAWMQIFAKLEQQIEKNAADLAAKKAQVAAVQAEYDRVMLGWDTYWTNVPANVDPSGQIVFGIGRQHGLRDRDLQGNPYLQIVHAFQPRPDGSYAYVGEFKATRLEANRAAFAPNWRVRDGEIQTWVAGNGWRVRTAIPPAHKAKFTDLEVQLTIADEQLAAKQADLARQDAFLQAVSRHLQIRIGEIDGFEDLVPQGDKLPSEVIQGVLQTLLDVEEQRNAEVAEVDRLRRELLAANREFDRINAINGKLTQSLAPAAPAVSQREGAAAQ